MTQENSIENILKQRNSQYGSWETQAELSQEMKHVLHGSGNWETLSDTQRESIDMILHKVARIVNGNPNYKDSWTDIIGYAKLVEDSL